MINLHFGIPDELRKPAVALYYEAFKSKFSSLMTLDEALIILPDLLNSEQIIIALQDGQLAGLAGFQHGRKKLFKDSIRPFIKHLGIARGLFAVFVIALFGRSYKKSELLMDGICVDKNMRGQGIGSLLLEAIFKFAQQNGYKTIRLDVVDTNPKARELYERMGFKPTTYHCYPLAKRLMGFSASTTMLKVIQDVS
jgi:ribosomal protein S18 acetylase RimI-like enzyme